MGYNFEYDKKLDNYPDEDYLFHVTNKFLFNWKSKSLEGITSPEAFVKGLMESNKGLSRESIWYLLILNLIRRYAKDYELDYMKDAIDKTIVCIQNKKEINMFHICRYFNNLCYSMSGSCLVSSFVEDEIGDNAIFQGILRVKPEILKETEKYIKKSALNNSIIEDIIPKENIQNKFFSYNEFLFQMFVIYFFTSHEENLISGMPQDQLDIIATCFGAVEDVCNLIVKRNKEKIITSYCSLIAKADIRDGE